MPTGVYKKSEEHKRKIGLAFKGKKLTASHKKRIGLAIKGQWKEGWRRSPMLGKSQSLETKKKISESRLKRKRLFGYINSPETRKKMGSYLKGKKMPEDIKRKLSKALKGRKKPLFTKKHKQKISLALKGKPQPWNSGTNSHFWKGGVSKLSKSIKASLAYKNWRESLFQRDNWTCQSCKKRGGIALHPHHKKSFTLILEENNIKTVDDASNCKELWDINNGITLCCECHKKTESYGWNNYNLKHITKV